MIDNRRGIFAMSASVVVFIFNDALMKLASETMPSLQAIGLRGIFATAWCALAITVSGEWRHAHRLAHPAVALRGLLEAAAAITYLVALAYIPFAVATATRTPVKEPGPTQQTTRSIWLLVQPAEDMARSMRPTSLSA